jgi:uncharacterized protein YjlB
MRRETHPFADDGSIPNLRLPVLIYQGTLEPTADEVLGIAAGTAEVMLGGPQGRRFALGAGDVVVLPAGTGHCNAEHAQMHANIARVPVPDADPVGGGQIARV